MIRNVLITLIAISFTLLLMAFNKSQVIETRTGDVTLTDNLEIHVCWCYGIKVEKYAKIINQSMKVGEWNIIPKDKDLIISDINNKVYSYYHADDNYTYSITKDGTQTLRFKEYSVYFWSDNRIQLTSVNKTILVRDRNLSLIDKIDENKFFNLEELHQLLEYNSSMLLIKELNLISEP